MGYVAKVSMLSGGMAYEMRGVEWNESQHDMNIVQGQIHVASIT